jgi:hypothetical protein
MVMRFRKWYRHGLLYLFGIPMLGFGLMAMGCGPVKPFEPPRVGEIPDGPGLFTGHRGALVLSRDLGADREQTVPNATHEGKTESNTAPGAPSITPAAPDASSRKPLP